MVSYGWRELVLDGGGRKKMKGFSVGLWRLRFIAMVVMEFRAVDARAGRRCEGR